MSFAATFCATFVFALCCAHLGRALARSRRAQATLGLAVIAVVALALSDVPHALRLPWLEGAGHVVLAPTR